MMSQLLQNNKQETVVFLVSLQTLSSLFSHSAVLFELRCGQTTAGARFNLIVKYKQGRAEYYATDIS